VKMSTYLEVRVLLGQLIAVERHGGAGVPARLANTDEIALLDEAAAEGWATKTGSAYSITAAGHAEFNSIRSEG
jgi:hypothetical protein